MSSQAGRNGFASWIWPAGRSIGDPYLTRSAEMSPLDFIVTAE